jgi:hypothetical protein
MGRGRSCGDDSDRFAVGNCVHNEEQSPIECEADHGVALLTLDAEIVDLQERVEEGFAGGLERDAVLDLFNAAFLTSQTKR